jgi:hypothetical protein
VLRGLRLLDVARAICVSPMLISSLERAETELEIGSPYLARLSKFYATAPEQLVAEMERWALGEARRLLPGQADRGGSGPQAA